MPHAQPVSLLLDPKNMDVEKWVQAAYSALSAAKQAGRNCAMAVQGDRFTTLPRRALDWPNICRLNNHLADPLQRESCCRHVLWIRWSWTSGRRYTMFVIIVTLVRLEFDSCNSEGCS